MKKEIREYIDANYSKTVVYQPNDDGTLIGLPHPFTMPSLSMFKELYYWDTYFINEGLISDGKVEQAKNNVDNMLFLISKYGYMPNGSRTYYIGRSQPPFLSMMVLAVFEKTGDVEWLKTAYVGLKSEYNFWMTNRMSPTGLNIYGGDFEENQIDTFAGELANRVGLDISGATAEQKLHYTRSCVALWEGGWDCNSRFAERAEYGVPVDLNSLMFALESNLSYFSSIIGDGMAEEWANLAERRRELMNKLLWNQEVGAYFDYDYDKKEQCTLLSSACFYPLMMGIADEEQAKRTAENLQKVEFEYGVACSVDPKNGLHCQWDYPNLWAPVTYCVVRGLLNYGYVDDARRVADKFISTVERSFEATGKLWEKYDAVCGTMSAGCEYNTPEMFGWTAWIYIKLHTMFD